MITIFNRKELIITNSVKYQMAVRDALESAGIDYVVRTDSSVMVGSRGRTVIPGINNDNMYTYRIYVQKKQYEYAAHIIADCHPDSE